MSIDEPVTGAQAGGSSGGGGAPTGAAGGDLTGTYPNPTVDTGTITSAKILDGTIVDADINASAAITYTKLSLTASVAVGDMTAANLERAFLFGKGGAIGATETDAADFPFVVPFNCTVKRMKATLKTAASGAMIVQIRRAAATVTTLPSYSDVASLLVTFASPNVLATATGFSTSLTEGDFLGFSCSTGSGTSLMVELVVVLR